MIMDEHFMYGSFGLINGSYAKLTEHSMSIVRHYFRTFDGHA